MEDFLVGLDGLVADLRGELEREVRALDGHDDARDVARLAGCEGVRLLRGALLLRLELADFVDAVRNRRAPGVPAQAGRDALALATRIAEAMEAAQ